MVRRSWLELAAIGVALGFAAAASATETDICAYDARGGLAKVVHGGDVSNNVAVEYKHDKADNRTKVKVFSSLNPSPP